MLDNNFNYELIILPYVAQIALSMLTTEFILKLETWCDDNCEDEWNFDNRTSILFKSENDYVLAKLCWIDSITRIKSHYEGDK